MVFYVILILINLASYALDPPPILWVVEWGESIYDVHETSSNQFITAGEGEAQGLTSIAALFDEEGSLIWDVALPGVEARATGYWVEELDDGSFIVTGSHSVSSVSLSTALLLMITPDGEIEWIKTYSQPSTDCFGYRVLPLEDGGFVIAGRADPRAAPSWNNSLIIRTDSNGTQTWTYTHSTDYPNYCRGIVESDGNIVSLILGKPVYLDGGTKLIAFNPEDGSTSWVTPFYPDDLNELCFDLGGAMTFASDGSGFILLTNGGAEIAKTDLQGNLEWYEDIDASSTPYWPIGRSIDATMDGGYIYGGYDYPPPNQGEKEYFHNKGRIIKLNSFGLMEWHDTMWWEDSINQVGAIRQLSFGGYIGCSFCPGTLFRYAPETGIETPPSVGSLMQLVQNPFSDVLAIQIRPSRASTVVVNIFDSSGRLVDSISESDVHDYQLVIEWFAPDELSSGCYFVQVIDDASTQILRAVLLR